MKLPDADRGKRPGPRRTDLPTVAAAAVLVALFRHDLVAAADLAAVCSGMAFFLGRPTGRFGCAGGLGITRCVDMNLAMSLLYLGDIIKTLCPVFGSFFDE
ncbi:MAG: hypothetical protein HYR85_11700 [Planctomycetes bacterium]|nr:hypothetical protein [Planctomycetota bacterium]MBI3846063.1 hypothetical protein [Planctomycetota bacterium]